MWKKKDKNSPKEPQWKEVLEGGLPSKPLSLGKKAVVTLLALTLFLVCSGVLYVTKLASLPQRVPQMDMDQITNAHLEPQVEKRMGGFWTLAIFGVDSRNGDLLKGNNADTILVCTINRDTGDVALASVYRDALLEVNAGGKALAADPGSARFDKINQAYMQGGPLQLVTALNANLDLKIDDYVSFSWKAAADAINLLGGIDLQVTKPEWTYMNSFITETVKATGIPSQQIKTWGMQHLDGVQAVAYSRLRLMDSDMARTGRQQKVVRLVLEKAKKASWPTLNQVLETVLPQTATSIDMPALASLAKDVKKYSIKKAIGFPESSQGVRLGRLGECLVPNTLESNVEQLHQALYDDQDYQCSSQVKDIGKEMLKQVLKN